MLASRLAAAAAGLYLVVSLLAPAASARPIEFPAEDRTLDYSGDLPLCDDFGILAAIRVQFDSKQFEFENADLAITGFESAAEVGYRKHGLDLIPRRYCEANATFTDGRSREVKFNIIEGGGFAGFGPGVEFCAVGEDKAHAFPPHCSGAVR